MYLKFDVRWFSGAQGSPFLTSVLINQLEAWERKHNKDIRLKKIDAHLEVRFPEQSDLSLFLLTWDHSNFQNRLTLCT